ncbi:RAMP superfamily CRISPR-associated protein [Paenibacillus sp. GCM10027627]|uniref:RAMP superfamily CRISPR-associated protein n=1 Tax=unclassified Paenibacillus TaxID=185978 RepID=UPI003644BBDD
MKSGWLEIELRSELTTGTGNTWEGLIDVDIAHVGGLPIIPSKRLKGALLETGKELVDWGLLKAKDLYALFGTSGLDVSSPLQIQDAHLHQIQDGSSKKVIENVPELLRQLKVKGWEEQEVLESFTSLFTRTAIDERDGSAKEGHLRTVRAVHKGVVLRCRIDIDERADNAALENTLRMCVKGLRHLGLANTRGSGEVTCHLTGLATASSATASQATAIMKDLGDGKVEFPFHLELDQPIIIAGRKGLADSSEDWIPGSTLLGAFAALYIREYDCGQQAHEDKRFSRIFLRGGVHFGYALPMVEGRVFAPSAIMWQQEKNETHGFDLMRGIQPQDAELRNLDGMVYADWSPPNPILYQHRVRKQVRMHHSRANNRAIGRALGSESSTDERQQALEKDSTIRGQLYQYEAIEAGQRFYGLMQGKREDVQLLLELAEKYHYRLRLGRSRTAEYGNVRFVPRLEFCPVLISEEIRNEASPYLALSLVTPMLLLDECGRPDPNPRWLLEQISRKLDCDVIIQSARLRYTTLSGYNAKWRLPKTNRPALDAGSALVLKFDRPIAGMELESIFWGWDTAEGNGQVRVISLCQEELGKLQSFNLSNSNCNVEQPSDSVSTHPLLIWLAERKQRKQWILEQQALGADCADHISIEDLQKVGLTKIQQMKSWMDSYAIIDNGSRSSYDAFYNQIEQIKNKSSQQNCLRLIRCCEERSDVFIRSYLRALELRARGNK